MSTFGEVLKKLREQCDKTQEEIAQHIGVSRYAVSKYENNQREPDMKILSTLALYFDVSIDYLTGKSSIKGKPDYISDNIRLVIGNTPIQEVTLDIKNKIGVTIVNEQIEQYLAGKSTPSLSTIQVLADYAGVETEFFYQRNDPVQYESHNQHKLNKAKHDSKETKMKQLIKNRAFIRIMEKMVDHELNIETVEMLIDTAINIKNNQK